MSQAVQSEISQDNSAVFVQPIVARIRRLVVAAVLAAAGYAAFTVSGTGYCPGGVAADGSFVDGSGDPTDTVPKCISLNLQPSFLVFAAIAAIVVIALTLVLRRAHDLPMALRVLDRSAAVIIILAVACIVISQVWFSMIPITDWNGSGSFFFPFPFGSVDVDVTPMNSH